MRTLDEKFSIALIRDSQAAFICRHHSNQDKNSIEYVWI
jgi:hypothetical protein